MTLHFRYSNRNIQSFVHLFDDGKLNLEPSFQRDSVWSLSDRRKLIESVLQHYPMPSIFLYENDSDGRLVYDVIDGKQRLESILMFQGRFRGKRFTIKTKFDSDDEVAEWGWGRIQQKGYGPRILSYEMQTIQITGDLSDIIEIFLRINSTGKKLTEAEKRHARFFHSDFLKAAGRLAARHEDYFIENRILSRVQISRMKHVELVSELLASILNEGPINKKKALDNIIGGGQIAPRSLKRCLERFTRTLNIMKRMFPEIRASRFANAVDYYSLFMLIYELDQQTYILSDSKRNRQAQKLLVWLSTGVDEVRQRVRKAEGAKPEQRLFADYLLTVQGDTDSLATRKRRADILRQLLGGGLFEEKDRQRSFTPEQRRIIWHSDERKKCRDCGDVLTWNNFTIDHVKAHARGGRTVVTNAALRCRPCNSRKNAN